MRPATPDPRRSNRRIFHIDDDADMVASVAALLIRMGHDVAFTTDPRRALGLAREFCPDLILMDIGMPKVDGYELCRTFRASADLEQVWIIAVSAYGGEQDRQKSRRAGFDAHIQKPVDLAVLSSILAECGNPLERRAPGGKRGLHPG
jgi:CheY-like chemotaxis protein